MYSWYAHAVAEERGRESGSSLTDLTHTQYLILRLSKWHEEAKCTEIGKKAWLFAKLQPGRVRKRINAT